ncbi:MULTISPECIES: TIGR01620 family protein [Halomonadaceae]|uniref:TIGR01620 family protein n=1 Tax=Halomonadaceae TaxID=28256 RepID=UPI0015834906|nr:MULTISPECIES: TIGR01620 family protein [Halomonas]MDI4636627.1 TIGR01620 family protein [Halomonas sp. BMC7]NUJ60992.1 TIGR01620 family protein [Halomonas taeanensis]
MTDPRPAQRFSEEPAAELDSGYQDPRPAQSFPEAQASRPLDDESAAEADLAASLSRPKRRRWGLLGLLGGGLLLGGVEAAHSTFTAALDGDWLAGAWSLLLLAGLGLAGKAIAKELLRLRRLRRHDALRERLDEITEATPQQAQRLAETLKDRLDLEADHPHWQGYLAAKDDHHGGAEQRVLIAHHLLAPRDREARRLIARMSGDTAVLVAASPLGLLDMALVAWRNLAMIDRLARLYGLELGYASRLKLFRQVLYNVAFAGTSELASDIGMEWLSMDLAGRLSTRAAQGLGVGLMSARLGLKALGLSRPLPFEAGEAPRLVELRRELWQRLSRLDDASSKAREKQRRDV